MPSTHVIAISKLVNGGNVYPLLDTPVPISSSPTWMWRSLLGEQHSITQTTKKADRMNFAVFIVMVIAVTISHDNIILALFPAVMARRT